MSALPVHHVTFSLLGIRRSPSFDIWCRIVWYKYEDVSGKIATSVVQLAKQAVTLTALVSSVSFESADFVATANDTGSMFPYNVVTRRHIPQDIYLNLQAEHCLYRLTYLITCLKLKPQVQEIGLQDRNIFKLISYMKRWHLQGGCIWKSV
jgi:hypothetical protein